MDDRDRRIRIAEGYFVAEKKSYCRKIVKIEN
jgi:hypothetical protein